VVVAGIVGSVVVFAGVSSCLAVSEGVACAAASPAGIVVISDSSVTGAVCFGEDIVDLLLSQRGEFRILQDERISNCCPSLPMSPQLGRVWIAALLQPKNRDADRGWTSPANVGARNSAGETAALP
jgi:hypothetical protein